MALPPQLYASENYSTGEMSLQAEEEMIVVLIALCRLSMGSRTIVEGSQEVGRITGGQKDHRRSEGSQEVREGTVCGSMSTSARQHENYPVLL